MCGSEGFGDYFSLFWGRQSEWTWLTIWCGLFLTSDNDVLTHASLFSMIYKLPSLLLKLLSPLVLKSNVIYLRPMPLEWSTLRSTTLCIQNDSRNHTPLSDSRLPWKIVSAAPTIWMKKMTPSSSNSRRLSSQSPYLKITLNKSCGNWNPLLINSCLISVW